MKSYQGKQISRKDMDAVIESIKKKAPSGHEPDMPEYQECGLEDEAKGGAHHCEAKGAFSCSKPFFCHGIHLNE